MAQAKRTSTAKSASKHRPSFHGLGILLVGMVIGSLTTVLWQGMQSGNGGIGTGIKQMIEQSKQRDQQSITDQTVRTQDKPVQQQVKFDFHTVLPGIEIVVPSIEQDSLPATSSTNSVDKTADNAADSRAASAYMLQAGSYKNKADAERLKAQLAFQGLVAAIQKVSIQNMGDFYRVRLGPYDSYNAMETVDQKLVHQGIKALRLKIANN